MAFIIPQEFPTASLDITQFFSGEPVWPDGTAVTLRVDNPRRTSVRFRFGSPLSLEVVACRHCLIDACLSVQTLSCPPKQPSLTAD